MAEKSKNKHILVSPSGNLYGSELVLCEYLINTNLVFLVYLPQSSKLKLHLSKLNLPHEIRTFNSNNIPELYLRILANILLNKVGHIYINEGGHIKYLLILTKIFYLKKYFVHLRIIEDIKPGRWIFPIPKNLTIFTVSNFLANNFDKKCHLIYDPYSFDENQVATLVEDTISPLIIGVIGRITQTKGLGLLDQLNELICKEGREGQFIFKLFGDVSEDMKNNNLLDKLNKYDNIKFEGFVGKKSEIYSRIHVVLHLSKIEALGRIFLEAIDFHKPFVGFNAGGIGEIGRLLNLESLLINETEKDPSNLILEKLSTLQNKYSSFSSEVSKSKQKATEIFSPEKYAKAIDKYIRQ